jgi:hypothetical protein
MDYSHFSYITKLNKNKKHTHTLKATQKRGTQLKVSTRRRRDIVNNAHNTRETWQKTKFPPIGLLLHTPKAPIEV